MRLSIGTSAGYWIGVAVAAVASVILVATFFCDIRLQDRRNLYVSFTGGSIWFQAYVPPWLTAGSLGPQSNRAVEPATTAVTFGRASHEIVLGPQIYFASRLPLWMIVVAGVVLSSALRWHNRHLRLCAGLCAECGYDLRGTPTNICSECGHTNQPVYAVVMHTLSTPPRRAILIHAVTALMWVAGNNFTAGGTGIWWPQSGSIESHVLQSTGMFAWIVVLNLWPVVENANAALTVSVLAAIVFWTIWLTLLFRSRFGRLRLQIHIAVALFWFILGQMAVPVVYWALA